MGLLEAIAKALPKGDDKARPLSALSDSEHDVMRVFEGWLGAARAHTEDVIQSRQCREAWDLYLGRHYYVGQMLQTYSEAKLNHFGKIHDILLAILTDSRPQMQAVGREPDDDDFARAMDAALEYQWETQDWDMKLPETMKLALLKGTTFCKETWDPFMRGGSGDIRSDLVDISQLYVDPLCPTSRIEDARYLIHKIPVDPYRLSVYYDLDLGELDSGPLPGGASPSLMQGLLTDSAGSQFTVLDSGPGRANDDSRSHRSPFYVYEIYFRTKKFPDGLCATVINGRIHEVKRNYLPGGYFPFVKFVDKEVPGSVHGKATAQDLIAVQYQLNHRASQIDDHLDLVSNPPAIIPKSMSFGRDDFKHYPGEVLQPNTTQEAEMLRNMYANVPRLDPLVNEMVGFLVQTMGDISGVTDALQGQRPEAVVSGRAVQGLTEAALTRTRLVTRNMENAIAKKGQLDLLLMLTNWSEERLLRTSSKEGQAAYHRVRSEVLTDLEGNRIGKYHEITTHEGYDENGAPKGRHVISRIDPSLDCRVITGSSVPVSKAQRFQQVLDMYTSSRPDDPLLTAAGVWRELPWLNTAQTRADIERIRQAAGPQGPPAPLEKRNVNLVVNAKDVDPAAGAKMMEAAAQQMAQQIGGGAEQAPPQQGGA